MDCRAWRGNPAGRPSAYSERSCQESRALPLRSSEAIMISPTSMQELFADTAHWIALQSPGDELHAAVLGLLDYISVGFTIVTSELVLFEFLNHFSGRGSFARRTASSTWHHLHSNPNVIIIPSTKALLEEAAKTYSKHADKAWSFTDCSSFAIMRERKIHEALIADYHFEQAGFRALLR